MPELIKMGEGIKFAEGPAYDGKGNLYVSNCDADYITRFDAEGKAEVVFPHTEDRFTYEKTNGMTFAQDGSLFACDFGRNAIVQIHPDGRMELYADKCEDQGFRGPNDLAFDPQGNLYFSDPTDSDAENPIGCVYRIAHGSRKVTKVAQGIAFPNGVALSADAKTLYIAESSRFRILRAEVLPDGRLGTLEVYCQLPENHIPDGINFDLAGNLYAACYGPALVSIISPNGNLAGTIPTPGTNVTNVEFGGKDLKTLYITEAQLGEVFKMQVEIGGLPLFYAPPNLL